MTGIITGEDEPIHYFQQVEFEQEKFAVISLLRSKTMERFSEFGKSSKIQIERESELEKLRVSAINSGATFLKMAKYKENPNAHLTTANDKRIMQTTKTWQNRDIMRLFRLFSDLEIVAKSGENLQYKIAEQIQFS
jgi:hypothetical protein